MTGESEILAVALERFGAARMQLIPRGQTVDRSEGLMKLTGPVTHWRVEMEFRASPKDFVVIAGEASTVVRAVEGCLLRLGKRLAQDEQG